MIIKKQIDRAVNIKGDLNGYEFDTTYAMQDDETMDDTLRRIRKELSLKQFRLTKQIDRVRAALTV